MSTFTKCWNWGGRSIWDCARLETVEEDNDRVFVLAVGAEEGKAVLVVGSVVENIIWILTLCIEGEVRVIEAVLGV